MPAEPSGKGDRRAQRIGKYEILKRIASGGMGTVYKARDTDLGRDVALKVLPPDLAVKPAMLERFRREARSAARLRHENIVTLYDFDKDPGTGTYYLALEFVDGIDLHDFICRRGKLKPDLARQILIQATRALAHAHEQGIVHRDIKPSNLLITQKDDRLVVKLTDMGLAREASDEDFRITRLGSTVGTIDYMAPEQARDSAAADIRSDIYSLGCTFYHMLAGNCPFPQGSLTERIYKHVEADAPDIRGINPEVPDGLATILRRMLQKKPENRYQTPHELLGALDNPEAAAGRPETVASRPDTHSEATDTIAAVPRPPSSSTRRRARSAPTEESVRVGKLATARPKSIAGTKKRFRGVEDEPTPRSARDSPTSTGLPAWWPLAACIAGVVVLVLIALLSLAMSGSRPAPDEDEPPPKKEVRGPDQAKGLINRVARARAEPLGVWPGGERKDEANLARLRADFEGPLRPFPAPPANAPILHVSRAASPAADSFRSLAAACAAAPAGRHSIIEIHDNGPLFEAALAPVSGRSLTIRAGTGYRPLIAWEGAGASAERFLSFATGELTLENLDLVLKGPDGDLPERPAAFVAIQGGTLAARGCTFSVAGKPSCGVQVVRLAEQTGPARCRLSHCFIRGAGLTAVAVRDAGGEILVDDCLIVSEGEQPLLDVRTQAACTLRLVRSTLVAGKNLLQVVAPDDKKEAGSVTTLCWDSLLARPGSEIQGEMIRVSEGAGVSRLNWRALNAVYAGWEKLLVSATRQVAATDAASWRRLWPIARDRTLSHPWPISLPPGLDESGPGPFDTRSSSDFPRAPEAPGPVGCDLAALPPARPAWLGLTYARFATTALVLPDGDRVPMIPNRNDGRYHGEHVRLDGQTDLGHLLRTRLQNAAPGPRVVLHVSGSGPQRTSPIQVRGADLVLYVHQPAGDAAPLTLVPNPMTAGGKAALIEVEGGSLEMSGVRVLCENTAPASLPVHVLAVQGGSLRLFGCQLQGPLTGAPPAYCGLIQFAGSGKDNPALAHACALHQCVLVSGRDLLAVRGSGARLRLRQCVLLSPDDGLVLDPADAAAARLNVQCSLEHNTFAVRRSAIVVKDTPRLPAGAEPIVIQADDNLFLDPFAAASPRSAVLAFEGESLSRGVVLWQGKGNGYDVVRLHAYVVAAADAMPARQGHERWAHLWGKAGEAQARLLRWPATADWTVNAERPQLDRLRLPSQVGLPPGADLARLGITGRP